MSKKLKPKTDFTISRNKKDHDLHAAVARSKILKKECEVTVPWSATHVRHALRSIQDYTAQVELDDKSIRACGVGQKGRPDWVLLVKFESPATREHGAEKSKAVRHGR